LTPSPRRFFFNLLLQNTKEGFFCDPIHGGNKGMVGWDHDRLPRRPRRFHGLGGTQRAIPLPGSFDSRARGLEHGNGNEKVDAVIVGFGWTGAIMAKELTEAGLNVLALERGPMQDTYPDGNYPQVIDELTYSVRKKLFQDISKETVTIRHSVNDIALPNRQLGAFLPGNGVGGAGLHWSGVHFRVDPIELRMRSHYEERYGKSFIPKDMTIQDFGVSYEELEPFFDYAEKVFGTSGQAWTVKGQLVGQGKGGNPYAPDRSNPFPLQAQKNTVSAQLFGKAATEVGYKPYNLPSANTSGPYTNPYGAQMGPCNFCGFCSGYVCYMYSKASPNVNILPALKPLPNFELRANSHVLRVNLDSTKTKATGVTYIDAQGREIEQPADLVILGAFQFHNVRLMLLSGIGKPYDPISGEGVVGKNFAYQNMATIKAFFDKDTHTNNFIGAGGNGVAIDDFNADNFDHGPHGLSAARRCGSTRQAAGRLPVRPTRRALRPGAAPGNARRPITTPTRCRWTLTARISPTVATTSIWTRFTVMPTACHCCG
jgi:gluconate 2-dehydrogenase alpha chain